MLEESYKERLDKQINQTKKLEKEKKEIIEILEITSEELDMVKIENENLRNQIILLQELLFDNMDPKKKEEIEKILNEKKQIQSQKKKNDTKIKFSIIEENEEKDL
jgi:hypothetical protein